MIMHKGILLYDPIDVSKNEWFINHFIEEAQQINISLKLYLTTDFYQFYNVGSLDYRLLCSSIGFYPDFVINRSRNTSLGQLFEYFNLRVFNPSYVTKTANDKDATYNYMSKFGINHLPYTIIPFDFIINDIASVLDTADSFGYPFVSKPAEGHGGDHVRLINTRQEYLDELNSLIESEHNFRKASGDMSDFPYKKLLMQKCASDTGKDLRAYVLGGNIISSIMRFSDKDFRANFSLGGQTKLHTLSEAEESLIKNISRLLPSDLIGIDLVYDNGMPVLNEIEDAVGCRMLYSNTDIDIVTEYLDYISSQI